MAEAGTLNCVIEAWNKYEGELRGFLIHQLHDHPLANAKSRVQRAHKRLKDYLKNICQVRFDEARKNCCFV